MPAALVPFFAVGTAALALSNFTCDKILDDFLDLALYTKENFDFVFAEQVHGPWAHAACEDVGNLMPSKEYR